MIVPSKAIDKQSLRGLSPLGKLTPDKIDDIVSKSRINNLPAGRVIFRQGENDGQTIYLLSGQIELSTAGKSRKQTIKGKSAEAKFPIADQIPRPATVRTKTASTLLYIDSSLLEILLDENPSGEYEVTEIDVADHATDWMMRFLQSPAFLKLPTKNIQKVLMSMEEIHVNKGETIFHQENEGDYYYIIKHGCCTVTRQPAEKAKEIHLAKLIEGDGFGEEALITNCKRNATVRMQEKGILMRLKKDDFLSFLVTPLIRNVHLNSLKSSLYTKSVFLDIRTNNEFKQGSLEKAQNIPLSMMRLRIPTLDTRKQYLIYAENKDNSHATAFLLAQHGINCLVVLGTLGKIIPITEKTVAKTKPEPNSEENNIPELPSSQHDLPSNQIQGESQAKQHEIKSPNISTTQPAKPLTEITVTEAEKTNRIHEDEASLTKKNFTEEITKLRLQAKQEAEKILAEAEAIKQSATHDAYLLRNKIEQEETLKLRTELENTRNKAEAVLNKSERQAKQIRQQAEQDSSQIRQQALSEAEKLREELNHLREQETQMKQQRDAELLTIQQQAAQQARIDAEHTAEEARIAVMQAADQVRNLALRDAEETRATTKETILAAEKTLAITLIEAEKTRIAAEQAATKAKSIVEQLTKEAQSIEKQVEHTRQKAEHEATAIRQAAREEASKIKFRAIEESKKLNKYAAIKAKSLITHDNIFNLDDELSPTIKPLLPYADESSVALKMAEEIKEKLRDVEEQRIKNEQQTLKKARKYKVDVKKLGDKLIFEGEKDIFIFREPKKQDSAKIITEQASEHIPSEHTKQMHETTHTKDTKDTINDLPTADSSPTALNTFDFPIIQPDTDGSNKQGNHKYWGIIVGAALVIALSLAAYTTKIQFDFTKIGTLINQDTLKTEKEKIKIPPRNDFNNETSPITKK